MNVQKAIHQSWQRLADPDADPASAIVAFDFSGTFTQGSFEGTMFAGRIRYDTAALPSDSHVSFAVYEDWPEPIVTLVVGGQVLSSQGAAVYDSVFDGQDGHFDFVNMFGEGPFLGVEEGAFFELFFADEQATALSGTRMPSARQLRLLPVKQMSFGTNAPGNVISRGPLTLSPAG